VVGTGAGSVDSTIKAYCIRLIANHNTLCLTQVKRKILGTQVAQMGSQVGVTPPATEKEPVWRNIAITLKMPARGILSAVIISEERGITYGFCATGLVGFRSLDDGYCTGHWHSRHSWQHPQGQMRR
jgi:hypothetical protein